MAFSHDVDMDTALQVFDRMGYRPAEAIELVTLGGACGAIALGNIENNPDGNSYVAYVVIYDPNPLSAIFNFGEPIITMPVLRRMDIKDVGKWYHQFAVVAKSEG